VKVYDVSSISLDLTVFLEGPYNGADMNTNLNTNGLLPLSQPFNISPWYYNGLESTTTIPPETTDWVLVELRDAADATSAIPSTRAVRQAGFLMKDGSVKSMDGITNLLLEVAFVQNLFAIVWHRNHLGVMSANPVEGIGGVYSYNFTAGAEMAHGGDTGHKELVIGSNIYGMIGGDGDANGEVNMIDKSNVWILQAGQEGYKNGDFNLDGQVNNPDKNDIWLINQTKQSQVPE